VARGYIRRERNAAERHRLSVRDNAVDFHRFVSGQIFRERDEVRRATRFQHPCVFRARHDRRTGQSLQRCMAAHVVEVGMAADDKLDVRQLETEFLDAALDPRRRDRQTRIEQDMSLRRGDQKGAHPHCSDEMDVSDEMSWGHGRIPRLNQTQRSRAIERFGCCGKAFDATHRKPCHR
jgi:hypothetical protein